MEKKNKKYMIMTGDGNEISLRVKRKKAIGRNRRKIVLASLKRERKNEISLNLITLLSK